MVFNLHFEVQVFTTSDSATPIPASENYDYWVPLAKHFLSKPNTIEIHCWNEEEDIIKEITAFHKNSFKMDKEENLIIFKGPKNPGTIEYLLSDYLNKNDQFKWFSVFLYYGSNSIFHSGHWATEFFSPVASESDLAFIKRVMPTDTNLNKY